MKDTEFKTDVMFKLGAIEQHLKSLNGKVDRHSTKIDKNTAKINKHDAMWGKAGIVVVAVIFAVSKGIDIGIDWIKNRL